MLQKKNKTSPYCDSKRRQEKEKNKRDLLHRLRNERIERERERERERESPTHTHKHMHNPYPALEGCEVTVTDAALSRFLVRRRVGHENAPLPRKDLLEPQEPSPL